MKNNQPLRIKTIKEFHRIKGLSSPLHPLISIVNFEDIWHTSDNNTMVHDFYSIALKRNLNCKIKYGQQDYDFDEGVLFFIGPGQVYTITAEQGSQPAHSGWMLLVHPDFFWGTSLAKHIKQYDFFDYSVNEALFLSEKEETTVTGIIDNIRQEFLSATIDKFSQNIVVAQIELFLSYAERFYQRQFITRKISNHRVLDSFEKVLEDYFDVADLTEKGLPTVQYISEQLNISPNYLSSLLKTLTGQSTLQHINEKLVARAKEKLSTTQLSVSEIAYELGFEHPQSFSKFFKLKTSQSPLEFRSLFN